MFLLSAVIMFLVTYSQYSRYTKAEAYVYSYLDGYPLMPLDGVLNRIPNGQMFLVMFDNDILYSGCKVDGPLCALVSTRYLKLAVVSISTVSIDSTPWFKIIIKERGDWVAEE